jgi:hypothetical protein
MPDRRQFIGAGFAVTASSLTVATRATHGAPAFGAGAAIDRIFVYQARNPDAIEAGRVMAGQGIPVVGYDDANPASLDGLLCQLGSRADAWLVGLTDASVFRQVQFKADQAGLRLVHSAPAIRRGLVHWIVGAA